MQSEPTQSAFDQELREKIESGRVDEALAEFSRSARTPEDLRTLAFLFTQRGHYERAAAVLESGPSSGGLDAASLRLRGNALWHAGRLNRALRDLGAADRAATTAVEQEAIRADVAVLRDEIALMQRVDQRLARVDGATVAIAVVLLAALIETHRRLFGPRRSPRMRV